MNSIFLPPNSSTPNPVFKFLILILNRYFSIRNKQKASTSTKQECKYRKCPDTLHDQRQPILGLREIRIADRDTTVPRGGKSANSTDVLDTGSGRAEDKAATRRADNGNVTRPTGYRQYAVSGSAQARGTERWRGKSVVPDSGRSNWPHSSSAAA
ncbi:hypothetical protein [Burkholderia seminalis]|uniref:hypothetical protein n=1 Tax=Burkholderia seminalis TaxID=488731 RepID=UPI00158F390F|nr:hypothetical protein [Burkholderia seminalis]